MKRTTFDVKQLLLALVPAAVLIFSGAASAQIAGTDHDLSGTISTGTDRICIFCHTPHTSASLNFEAPLWNRSSSAVSFTMYDSNFSPTIDMTVAATPQGISMGCLSCHDGATAFNALINTAGQTITTNPSTMSGSEAVGAGGDLTNDHPISVTYDPAQDPDFVALATVQSSTLVRLFGSGNNQVECASCHDPHDDTNQPFLRVANTSSQICTSCHSK